MTRRREAGFVLAATVWALAGLALIGAYVDQVVSSGVAAARERRAALRVELDRRSTEATVLYLLSTSRLDHRGLVFGDGSGGDAGEDRPGLRVDGTVYAGLGATRLSVQDEAGLVSVNAPRSWAFRALLARHGVRPAARDRVVARIEDYIDADDEPGLDGAERAEYRASGRAGPLNWIFATPLEAGRVLGLREAVGARAWRSLQPVLTVRPASGYNFNTMHRELLALVLDVGPGAVERLVAERGRAPVVDLDRIALLTGVHLEIDPMEFRALPSPFFRITLWEAGAGRRSVLGVELTPLGDRAPWRVDYRYDVPAAEETDGDPLGSSSDLLR